ncbi:phosphotransferase family protein [Lichenibacterium dinghuense]|uniref:phosphotransferase family protein n=1 Tax=Lichenibacterium dinghuense TaxID=2895977 RepID=UPI001F2FDAC1|nr:aminoglycoside phosphotransferase family protein [Lichenibacterium sp. 6Y81]
MFLTASNLFFYLRDAGLCSAADVVGEDFAVSETGRRNRNFVVRRAGPHSLFVKQIPMMHPEVVGSLRREAACAQLAQEAGEGLRLRSSMPVLLRYDPVAHILVYRFVEGAENLNQRVVRDGPLTIGQAERIGTALAACHSETARPGALLGLAPLLKAEPPWLFNVVQQPHAVMPGMNEPRRRVIGALQQCPEVLNGMERLRAGWRRLCLMHGDVKFDNILVGGAGDDAMLLIDWELAELGDPLWDVASALAAIVQPWLIGAVVAGKSAAPQAAGSAVVDAARGLWSAYLSAVDPSAGPPDPDLLARLVGARLVLLAFELLPDAVATSPQVDPVLALARYFLAAPAAALLSVFGIGGVAASGRPTMRAIP